MPVESTSKRRCARRSRPTVSPPSPEGRGGQGVRTGTETGQGGEDPNGDGSGGEDPNGDGVRGGGSASIERSSRRLARNAASFSTGATQLICIDAERSL